MIDPDAAVDFLDFVAERHRVWERRQAGEPAPWTSHPILSTKKFTNVFRVLDYGSQFLLNELIDPELDPRDQLMRCFLYRHTGKWEVWQFFEVMEGRYPLADDLDLVLEHFMTYRGGSIEMLCGTTTVGGGSRMGRRFDRPIFTPAYLVFPQSDTPGTDKLESIVDLTRRLFDPASPTDIVPDFLAATTQATRFHALRRNRGVADFMSMQTLTDWGYTPQCGEDRENEFVVLGPGAKKGALALAPGVQPEATLRWAVDAVRDLPNGPSLFGRPPSMMDVQNCLCEFSKFVRGPASKPYAAAHPGPQPVPTIPDHWSMP